LAEPDLQILFRQIFSTTFLEVQPNFYKNLDNLLIFDYTYTHFQQYNYIHFSNTITSYTGYYGIVF